jgi:hypothetical protein
MLRLRGLSSFQTKGPCRVKCCDFLDWLTNNLPHPRLRHVVVFLNLELQCPNKYILRLWMLGLLDVLSGRNTNPQCFDKILNGIRAYSNVNTFSPAHNNHYKKPVFDNGLHFNRMWIVANTSKVLTFNSGAKGPTKPKGF